MTSPFRLGFPRFSPAKPQYEQRDEAQFRLTVEQLLRALTSATNDTVAGLTTITSTLAFVPDNTIDVGDPIGPYRPRNVYAATSVISPRGAFSTRVTSPLLGTTTNADVVLDRNGVPQVTLSSLLATFAGAGTFNGVVLPGTANTHDLGSTTATWQDAYFEGTGYFGGLASLQASDPLAGVGAVTPITLRDYGRNVFEYRTDSTLEYDGPGTHFVRRSATGGAALINWVVGELSFSGGYGSAATTLTNAIIYGQARETFTTYGTHGATDLVFGTKASGTTTTQAQAKARLLAEGHWVGQTDNTYDLGADTTTGGTLRRWRSLRLGTDLRIDAGTGVSGIVHQYFRSTGGTLRWGQGLIGLDSGSDAGSNYALWRYSDAGSLLGNWLTVTRSTGAWAVTGDATITGFLSASTELRSPSIDTIGATDLLLQRNNVTQLTLASLAATFAGDLTVTGDNLNVNGLTYTWPASQTANRLLRNTGPGTLAWSQVDLSTDVTGALAGGTVPAAQVTAGTFGAGAYTFPSTLTVTSTLTQNGTSASLAQGATASVRFGSSSSTITNAIVNRAVGNEAAFQWETAASRRWRLIVTSTAESGANAGSPLVLAAYDDTAAFIDSVLTVTRAANGTIAFASNRPITGGTYNGQTISSAANFTGTVTIAGNNLILSNAAALITMGADTATSASIILNSAVGNTNIIRFRAAGNNRWSLFTQGANEPFMVRAYDNAGTTIDDPLTITRAAGGTIAFASGRPVSMGSSLAITGALSGVTTLALSGQLTSTLATGTAPFVVASTTKVANLNADLLDDQTGSYYLDLANATGMLDETLGGTGLTSYTLGDLLYGSASNTLSKLAGNTSTTGMYLKQTGTGSASAAPVWDTLTAADVGAGTFAGAFTFDTDITYSASGFTIKASTADAADSNALFLAGGGAASTTRGAYIRIAGNEYGPSNGTLLLVSGGNPSTGITLLANGSTGGGVTLTPDASGLVQVNGSGLFRADTEVRTPSLDTVGATDLTISRNNTLVLTVQAAKVLNAQDFDVASGKVYKVNNVQVVSAQGAAVADATGAGDVVAQLNALLARVRAHGLIAT